MKNKQVWKDEFSNGEREKETMLFDDVTCSGSEFQR